MAGSLIVIGTGIRTVGQLTLESIAWIRQADKVLYVVGDPIAEAMIRELNPDGAESLSVFYGVGKQRIETYNQMIDRILECVRGGLVTCVASYGHPGVFVYPTHEAIRRARAEGYEAKMLPGISAEDCLFADLNVDPGILGCQSYEATDFMANGRIIDNSSSLILWQIGVVGDATFKTHGYDTSAMPLLVQRLMAYYPASHPVYLYEAAVLPGCEPTIINATVAALPTIPMSAGFTAYIPPARQTTGDPVIVQQMQALRGG
ncbi:MAG TPA: SAM-dependent methyltransferase [Allosphingosinicella sp.]|nr:SAM-dependent methyltransferase [Allosphingosinicella sp.]